jgi:hypothetical protein
MERSLCGFLPFHDNDGSNFLAPEKKERIDLSFLAKAGGLLSILSYFCSLHSYLCWY